MRDSNVPKLRFKGFSDEWEEKRLNEITTYVDYRGKTPTKTEYGIFLVTAKNIKKGYIDYNASKEFIAKEDYEEAMRRGLPKIGDVLLTTEAPLGNVAQIDKEDIALAQRVIKFRGVEKKLNNTFLKQYFISEVFQNELINKAIGTTVLGIQGKVLHKMKIKIPKLEEQEKIANFLSKVDKIIEKQEEKVSSLEKYKKGMMQKIFSQEIRFKNDDGGEYPEWEVIKLSDICTFFSGGTPLTTKKEYYDGEIPFIRSAEISKNETELTISHLGLENSSAKMVYKGDLLYALYGATSGEVAISKIDGAINQAILCIRSKRCNLYYLEKVLKSSKETIIGTYLQGGQGNLSANIIKDLKYNIPTVEEQNKIANFLSKIDSIVEKEKERLEELREWKKGLLQQMLV